MAVEQLQLPCHRWAEAQALRPFHRQQGTAFSGQFLFLREEFIGGFGQREPVEIQVNQYWLLGSIWPAVVLG